MTISRGTLDKVKNRVLCTEKYHFYHSLLRTSAFFGVFHRFELLKVRAQCILLQTRCKNIASACFNNCCFVWFFVTSLEKMEKCLYNRFKSVFLLRTSTRFDVFLPISMYPVFCCLLLNLPWHTFPVQIDENFTLSTQKKWGGVHSVYLYRRASVKVFPAFAMMSLNNNNKTVIDQWMMYGDCISVSQKRFYFAFLVRILYYYYYHYRLSFCCCIELCKNKFLHSYTCYFFCDRTAEAVKKYKKEFLFKHFLLRTWVDFWAIAL